MAARLDSEGMVLQVQRPPPYPATEWHLQGQWVPACGSLAAALHPAVCLLDDQSATDLIADLIADRRRTRTLTAIACPTTPMQARPSSSQGDAADMVDDSDHSKSRGRYTPQYAEYVCPKHWECRMDIRRVYSFGTWMTAIYLSRTPWAIRLANSKFPSNSEGRPTRSQ